MRIVAGAWRGRVLTAPAGDVTRPTADRVRQALFDMLAHSPWAPAEGVRGQIVLDAFAGTGALGLEALSRGAASATFFERDRAALAALHHNIGVCRGAQAVVREIDAFHPPRAASQATLVFLDPPYGMDAPARALTALRAGGWIAAGALLVIETGREETVPAGAVLAERSHGRAKITIMRAVTEPDG